MLGEKIKALRLSKGLVQRQIAEVLNVDIAYVSKMEHSEKPVNRAHLKKLSHLFDFPEQKLKTLWLADKLFELTKNEPEALKAVNLIQNKLIKLPENKQKSKNI